MNLIKRLIQKASTNTGVRKIQIQFLMLLVTIMVCIVGLKYFQGNYKLNHVFVTTGLLLIVGVVVYFKPAIIRPFLWVWLLFGLIVGEVTSAIILGIIFYALFSPITFAIRILKRKSGANDPKWVMRKPSSIDYSKLF